MSDSDYYDDDVYYDDQLIESDHYKFQYDGSCLVYYFAFVAAAIYFYFSLSFWNENVG